MKSKIAVALGLCLTLSCLLKAQNKVVTNAEGAKYTHLKNGEVDMLPDSIRLEFPEQQGVVIFNFDGVVDRLDQIREFPGRLALWLNEIEAGVSDTVAAQNIKITLHEDGSHSIVVKEQTERTTRLTSKNGKLTELLPPGWDIHIETGRRDEHIDVYGPTLWQLKELARQKIETAADSILAENKAYPLRRKGLVSRMVVRNNAVQFKEMIHQGGVDLLDANLGAGFGYVNGAFFPEIHAGFNLYFGDRWNISRHRVSLTSSYMFFSGRNLDGSFKAQANGFLNLSYGIKVGRFKDENPNWLGIGGGLLVRGTSDVFQGRTAKFFVTSTVGRFTLSPEFYYTNDFKTTVHGFKISYNF